MKKLIFMLILFSAVSAGAEIYIMTNGSAVEIQSVNTIVSGSAVEVTPKYASGGIWYSILSYFDFSAEYRLIVVTISQSNGVGNPRYNMNTGTIPTVTDAGFEIKTDGTYVNPMAEPTGTVDPPFDQSGEEESVLDAGSAWLALANRFYALTGQKIILLSIGVNGSTTQQWIDGYNASAKTRIDTALSRLTAAGYDYIWEDLISIIGESDNYSGWSVATHKANMLTCFNYFKTHYPDNNLKLRMAQPYSGYVFGTANAQVARAELASENSDIYLSSDTEYTTPGVFHLIQWQLNEVGEEIAEDIAGE